MTKLFSIIFIAAIAFAAGCHRSESSAEAAPAQPPAMVSAAPAIAKDVPLYIEEIGKTAARESVTIQPQVTGKVMEIHFTDGANTKKGDLLFIIDPRPYQAALMQAEATLAQNHANLEWSRSELKRIQSLAGTGAVSASDIESKQNAVAVAEAQIKAGEAAVQQAKLNLEYCTLKSPIDGRTGRRLVDVGNVVVTGGADGGTKMLVIQRLDPIYADFTIPEQRLVDVRKHMATGELRTQVWIGNDSADFKKGSLTFLDNTVMPGAGTVKLRATLPNSDSHFWPGQFVNVRLVLSIKKDAVLVPTAAQQIGQQGPYVYVIKPDNTAELRVITPGQRQGDLLVVEKGVAAGEQVIIAGQMSVLPGGKVQVMSTAPPATAPAAVAEGVK